MLKKIYRRIYIQAHQDAPLRRYRPQDHKELSTTLHTRAWVWIQRQRLPSYHSRLHGSGWRFYPWQCKPLLCALLASADNLTGYGRALGLRRELPRRELQNQAYQRRYTQYGQRRAAYVSQPPLTLASPLHLTNQCPLQKRLSVLHNLCSHSLAGRETRRVRPSRPNRREHERGGRTREAGKRHGSYQRTQAGHLGMWRAGGRIEIGR